jgi:hypothetical protein
MTRIMSSMGYVYPPYYNIIHVNIQAYLKINPMKFIHYLLLKKGMEQE